MNLPGSQRWAAFLVVSTVVLVVCAGWNFQQQGRYPIPDDGAVWVDRNTPAGQRVVALHVVADGPAERAGLHEGDVLIDISGVPIRAATDVPKVLFRIGAWNKASYRVERHGVELQASVYLIEKPVDATLYYQYLVGLAYLLTGLLVFVRRSQAQHAYHFYLLCLLSFVLSTFHYTGVLNTFDKLIYWGNVAAGVLAPTVFLHFSVTFPAPHPRWKKAALPALLYLPAALLLGFHFLIASGHLRVAALSLVEVRWLLDRLWTAFLAGCYLLGAAAIAWRLRHIADPVQRHQLKWLRNGVIFGVGPFTLLYAVPYALGAVPGSWMSLAVLSLIAVPVMWAYAVLRYRLMDVDVVLQQGYAYTLATLAVLGVLYGFLFSVVRFDELTPTAIFLLVLVAAFVFQPIRAWVKEQLDRHYFYRDRYDYRQTLVEFARELGSETDLDAMVQMAAARLQQTLAVPRIAFFLRRDPPGQFELHQAFGFDVRSLPPLDLSFLAAQPDRPYWFFDRPESWREVAPKPFSPEACATIAELGLSYYVPCTVRGRAIAYLGLSRTATGDFLTSEDLKLVTTVCGYLAIAIENAQLYRSLQAKVEQYERLKEFSENIVESINVGIVAVGLDDRIESWNTQMELLTGIPRESALGRKLSEIFPPGLMKEVELARSSTGIHHVSKYPLDPAELPAELRATGWQAISSSSSGRGIVSTESRRALVNVAIAPLVSKNLDEIGRLIIFDDVTERAELERKLIEADKLSSIGLLAAGVAHEVNTPLAVISTYAQMLARQLSGDEQKSRMLEKIAQQTFRASEIVNSLLNFSRTSPVEFQDVDLNSVIKETLSLIEHQLEKAHIRVQLDLQEPLPRIRGNANKLQQVFLNLFLNARDAMETGGLLRVRTRATEDSVTAEVADTGKGMPPEVLARIYDPFFTTKTGRKGTGLGLSVTYGIVREHGGTIEVESLPGAGTCFHLDFPQARKPVSA